MATGSTLFVLLSAHGFGGLAGSGDADVPGAGVEVSAELLGDQRDDTQMESAVNRLSLEPAVTSVRWSIQESIHVTG